MIYDYMPEQNVQIDQPFLMTVQDVIVAKDRGIAIYGSIQRGSIEIGDEVEIIGQGKERLKITISEIDASANTRNLILFIKGLDRKDVHRGQVLAKPGTIQAHSKVKAKIHLFPDKSGLDSPYMRKHSGYIYINGTDVYSQFIIPEEKTALVPGDSLELIIEATIPTALEKGSEFGIGRGIGKGIVTEIIE